MDEYPQSDEGTGILGGILLCLLIGLGFYACSADAAPCGTIQSVGDCTPLSDPDPWSTTRTCEWVSQHPRQEHVLWAFLQTRHCTTLGGSLQGGLEDKDCFQTHSVGAFPYLPGVFSREGRTKAAQACAAASGVPVGALLVNAGPKEWIPANCPNWANWSLWAKHADADPNKLLGLAFQANTPSECVDWGV